MVSLEALTAALLDVRAYLVREALIEELRNEAAWEAGSSCAQEHAAIDALARLDEALSGLEAGDKAAVTRETPAPAPRPRDLAA